MSDMNMVTTVPGRALRTRRARRLGSLVAALLLTGVGLTGCSADAPDADADAQGVDSPAATDDATGDEAATDDEDADGTEPDQADEPDVEGDVAVPDGIPAEIPLPEEHLKEVKTAGEKGWMLTYDVDMDDDQVLERYQTLVTDAGFSAEIGTPTDANLTATGPDWMVTVARNHGMPLMNITVIIN